MDRAGIKDAFIYLLGFKPRKNDVERMIRAATGPRQVDGAGVPPEALTCEQFVKMMLPIVMQQDPEEQVRQTFEAFDRGGAQFLTIEDVYRAVGSVAGHIPRATVNRMFAEADSDANGKLSYREFRVMMMHPRPTLLLPTPGQKRAEVRRPDAGCSRSFSSLQ